MSTQTISRTDLASEEKNLRSENSSLKQIVASLQQECSTLKEQVEWFKRQIFGQRSEKIKDPVIGAQDLPGFVYPEAQEQPAKEKPVTGYTRREKSRDGKDAVTLPEGIPVETKVIDIPEEEKVCKETGESLVKIGEEVTRKLAHKPGSYYVKEIIRPKYAIKSNPDAGIITAELPDSLLPRCQVDESFLAETLVKKYGDHLPLYRQCEILSREQIFISRQLLCQWVIKAAMTLKPLHNLMVQMVLESKNAFVDETPIRVLDPGSRVFRRRFLYNRKNNFANNPSRYSGANFAKVRAAANPLPGSQ